VIIPRLYGIAPIALAQFENIILGAFPRWKSNIVQWQRYTAYIDLLGYWGKQPLLIVLPLEMSLPFWAPCY
jgi:hypothetical protein